MGKQLDDRGYLEDAMAALAGLGRRGQTQAYRKGRGK